MKVCTGTGEIRDFTEEEIAQYELDQAEQQANQWLLNRQNAYPTIQDQLDMQYWDSINGTTTWADTIAQVKADIPKP